MANIPEYLNTLNGWIKVLAAVEAHSAELPYLAEPSSRLEGLFQRANDLSVEYSALTANKQDVGQRLQQALREGDALASFLRKGARERFGTRSEILVQFGLQPLRTRSRPVPPPPRSRTRNPPLPRRPSSPRLPLQGTRGPRVPSLHLSTRTAERRRCSPGPIRGTGQRFWGTSELFRGTPEFF